jgi:zinc/manganese transport system permease protein
LLWARRFAHAFAIAGTVALLSALFGLWLSFHYDLPAGPSVVAVCGALTVIAAIGRLCFASA